MTEMEIVHAVLPVAFGAVLGWNMPEAWKRKDGSFGMWIALYLIFLRVSAI